MDKICDISHLTDLLLAITGLYRKTKLTPERYCTLWSGGFYTIPSQDYNLLLLVVNYVFEITYTRNKFYNI